MKFTPTDPPRAFDAGRGTLVRLRDCARIELEADEQVTFVTGSGAEYDVARKSWGYYAMPSLNGRLPRFGLRAVLVKAPDAKYYVFLVEYGKEVDFQSYLDVEGHVVVWWLDSDNDLEALERKLERE